MRFIRFTLLLLALISLSGWWVMRRPVSPTDQLPAVRYAAFELSGSAAVHGDSLATIVRTWNGVTAVSFNPTSDLLTLSVETHHPETGLLDQLDRVAGQEIRPKVFDTPSGPQCPVPARLLIELPRYLLMAGLLLGGIGLSFFIFRRPAS